MIPENLNGSLGSGVYNTDDESAPVSSSGNIVLELTENEAAVLLFILGHIGGSISGTRGYSGSVRTKLLKLGSFKCDKPIEVEPKSTSVNNIYLK